MKYFDNASSSVNNFKIKQKYFNKIVNLMENLSKTNIDDAVVFSFIHFIGIGVEQN